MRPIELPEYDSVIKRFAEFFNDTEEMSAIDYAEDFWLYIWGNHYSTPVIVEKFVELVNKGIIKYRNTKSNAAFRSFLQEIGVYKGKEGAWNKQMRKHKLLPPVQ